MGREHTQAIGLLRDDPKLFAIAAEIESLQRDTEKRAAELQRMCDRIYQASQTQKEASFRRMADRCRELGILPDGFQLGQWSLGIENGAVMVARIDGATPEQCTCFACTVLRVIGIGATHD